ncbi:MAG: CAAX protease, partial [Candidatus Eremiobacteraeota bacterium]|nr:CAAX protease [Candidatus Eremiobacteraeota bacterium]
KSFGKPIAQLGARISDAVAGVTIVQSEQTIVDRAVAGSGAGNETKPQQNLTLSKPLPSHPNAWRIAFGLVMVGSLALLVALALDPVRGAMFAWQNDLPRVVRIPIDLFWLGALAVVVSGLMAPLETLGWWAGWYGDRLDATQGISAETPADGVSRYIIYLDGVAQSSARYTPDIETFLDAFSLELPKSVCLIRGVMSYSVMNRPLEDDPLFSAVWSFIDTLRFKNVDPMLGMIVNLRNVTIVAVSADARYGPMYNFGIAHVMLESLLKNGYRPNSGVPVTLIGYSGGGQMACGAARFLKRAIDAPIDVISLGGVISGNDPILDLEHLHHLVGDKDRVERIGPVLFPSRWKITVLSNWNRARRLGRLTQISLGPVGHQVPGGMLDPVAKLPDGRTNLRATLDMIGSILADRLTIDIGGLRKRPSRYEQSLSLPWNRPETFPIDAFPGDEYRPVGSWVGRLVLPQREERFGGAWFEVYHAPDSHAQLLGSRVQLQWDENDPAVAALLRAVRRDVDFSAEAYYGSTFGGRVHPVRINHWRLVDPLESLAASHPTDDVTVKLDGNVCVDDAGNGVTLRIKRQPVQVAGRWYALVRFVERAAEDAVSAVHFNPASRAFDGKHELVRVPGAPAGAASNGDWYVYGAVDRTGTFVVRHLVAYESARLENGNPWRAGDTALVVRTAGGFLGHFAYGIARVIEDPFSGDPRFETTYYQLFSHNTDGLIAGAFDWLPAMGYETILRHEKLESIFDPLALQLDAMSARYRIGDGTGGTYVGAANNSSQDSNRALAAALKGRAFDDLRRRLQPFGILQRAWSPNDFNLGSTVEDAPLQNALTAICSWRTCLPGLARHTVVGTLLRDGADVRSRKFGRACGPIPPPA